MRKTGCVEVNKIIKMINENSEKLTAKILKALRKLYGLDKGQHNE